MNEKKQLSFIYQPGVGLYDKNKSIDDQDQANESHLPIQEKSLSLNEILSDKNAQKELYDVDISTNQENHQKRKYDQNLYSNKKPCQTSENLEQKSSSIKLRKNSHEKTTKQPIPKSIPMVKRLSSDKEGISIPSQGLLLCPKEEAIKKKKKKKIAPTITAATELLDDDPVLDSILFDEMQSVQQQWQQFLILTMEKELHTNPSDGKKKMKLNKFNRTNEFLIAYESLYDFEGMKHWCPTFR